MNNIVNAYTKNEQLSFNLMTISVFLGLFVQCFQNYLGSFAIASYLSILAFGFLGILVYFSGAKNVNVYVRSFVFLIVYFVVIGLVGNVNFDMTIATVQDSRYMMFFLMSIIFAQNDRYMAIFHSIMKKLGIVAIILGIYALLHFSFENIATRDTVWTDQYYFWWASANTFVYLAAFSFVTKKDRIVGYGTLILYFILGAMFLKRSAFVNVIVIIVLSIIIHSKKPGKNAIIVLIGVFGLLYLLNQYFPEYFAVTSDALMDRFETIESIETVDRNVEAQLFFERAPLSKILLGYGAFNYPIDIIQGKTINALHNSWANIFFKGGIVYAIWYIWIYSGVLRNAIHAKKQNELFLVCLIVAISSLVSMAYEGGWTYTLEPFCTAAPIIYAAKKSV